MYASFGLCDGLFTPKPEVRASPEVDFPDVTLHIYDLCNSAPLIHIPMT